MEVILLERVQRLGQMGDVVRVRDGFARNFLLPQGKALRATEANRKRFESERTNLEARNLERRSEAEQVAAKLNGQSFVVVRQAAETGQLYGSVSTRDLAETMDAAGFKVERSQVALNQPIKTIGLHTVAIVLHPEVEASVTVNVARSGDEAERQARGEDLTVANAEPAEETAETEPAEGEEAAAEGEEAAAEAE
jgi:large subunit ribosomal protein L9